VAKSLVLKLYKIHICWPVIKKYTILSYIYFFSHYLEYKHEIIIMHNNDQITQDQTNKSNMSTILIFKIKINYIYNNLPQRLLI